MPILKEVEIKGFINLGIKKRYRDNQNLYLDTTKAKTAYWEVLRHIKKRKTRLLQNW